MKYRDSSEMKDSGVEWIGLIPKEWSKIKFKKIIDTVVDNRGKTPPLLEEGIPMVEMDALTNRFPNINRVKKFVSKDTYDSFLRKYLRPGDILFATVGSIGKTSIVPDNFNFCIAQNIVGYRTNREHDNIFWFHYINSTAFRDTFIQYNKGNIQDSIKISDLKEGYVVTPTHDKQQKIANFLDLKTSQFDSIIEKKERLIEKLEEAKKSLISEVVTGKIKIVDGKLIKRKPEEMKDSGVEEFGAISKYSELTKLKFYGDFKAGISKSGDYFGVGFSFVNYPDVYKNKEIENGSGLALTTIKERYDFSIKRGDVFFTRTSETIDDIGESCICKSDIKNGTYSGFIIRYRLMDKEKFDYKFLKFYFQNQIIKYYFANQLNIVTRASLSQEKLKELPFILPTFEEQKIIGVYLEKKVNHINNVSIKTLQQITNIKQAKQSLISEAVTGKIDLRDWEIVDG